MKAKDANFKSLENGKQVGIVFSFEFEGRTHWSSVAIQKWRGHYVVYIDEIEESKMAREEYKKELVQSFQTLELASIFIQENSEAKLKDLGPLKGQKIFNPSIY